MTLSAKVAELRERLAAAGRKYNAAIQDYTEGYESEGWSAASDHADECDAVARDALALLSEREADAERYRWLRDRTSVTNGAIGYTWDKTPSRLAATDSAIDAALAEKGPRQ